MCILQDRKRIFWRGGNYDNWQEPRKRAFDWKLLHFAHRSHTLKIHSSSSQLNQEHGHHVFWKYFFYYWLRPICWHRPIDPEQHFWSVGPFAPNYKEKLNSHIEWHPHCWDPWLHVPKCCLQKQDSNTHCRLVRLFHQRPTRLTHQSPAWVYSKYRWHLPALSMQPVAW